MRYEVTWMEYDLDWGSNTQEQIFFSEQFEELNDAMSQYEEKVSKVDIEHVKICAILSEFTR